MKKVAFILALALVFLVGTTTVLKHKIWAKGEKIKKNEIVLWIPINADGEAVLERVKSETKGKLITLPMAVDDWKEIHNIKNITVIKLEKNPKWCWDVCSEGECVEECVEY